VYSTPVHVCFRLVDVVASGLVGFPVYLNDETMIELRLSIYRILYGAQNPARGPHADCRLATRDKHNDENCGRLITFGCDVHQHPDISFFSISRSSAAMRLSDHDIFNDQFIANFSVPSWKIFRNK